MNYIKKFFGHLHTVNKHRFWVFYYCCAAGMPFRGLIHDLSKYSPTEFFESVKYYTGTSSPIDACKKVNGVSCAWLHHKGRNKHHYEYWQDNFDTGTDHLIMPYKYALEMVCDYLAAGKAYNGKNFSFEQEFNWWLNKVKSAYGMNESIQDFVTAMLVSMKFTNSCEPLFKIYSKEMYKCSVKK